MANRGICAAWAWVFTGLLFLQSGAPLQAQPAADATVAEADPPPPDPGTIPPAAFASRSQLGSAIISPDGALFAYTSRVDGKLQLTIIDAASLTLVDAVAVGDEDDFRWFRWAGPRRILISRMVDAATYSYTARFSRLLAFDLDAKKVRYIGFRKQSLEGDDVLHIDPSGAYIILSMSRRYGLEPEVWRFPLDGSGEDGAVRIQKKDGNIDEWWADNTGVVRFGMGWTRGSTMIYYRSGPEEKFRRITKLKKRSEELDNWDVISLVAGSDNGLAMVDGDDGKRLLRKLDYNTGELGEIVYEHPELSLDSTLVARDGQLLGVEYTRDEPTTHWFDEDMAKHQRMLETALGGGRIDIFSVADDQSRMLVLHSGPADPGALYVFSPAAKSLKLFANIRPEIDFRVLTPPKPFTMEARDGTSLRGYITLPKQREARALPLIVMPHGGPYGVRDDMTYDDRVQLLASRGYAVLQVNFRGSGGYGEAFERLGDGQMGRRMQDDLDDALDWAVGQGYVDPARVCLLGGSYGGYAALWGVIRNPERYRCAASIAGVTDFDDMLSYDRNYLGRDYYRRVWRDRVKGDTTDIDLSDVSPLKQVGRLQRPILMVHGTKDRRVPVRQFTRMVDAAKKAGKDIESLELDDGHSLSKEENEKLFYETLLAFLEKHNPAFVGPDAKAAPAEAE